MQKNEESQFHADLALVPALVGQVYQEASPVQRSRLLEQLVQPLGLLSLVAVARGIFARLMLSRRGREISVRPEDTRDIDVVDVVTLAQRAQQASMQALDNLAPVLAALSLATGSAAAKRLLAILAHTSARRLAHAGNDFDVNVL